MKAVCVHLSLLLLVCLQAISAMTLRAIPDSIPSSMVNKRDVIKEGWEDLGWAWGKRSDPSMLIPRRFLRSLHPVKKNPDWGDLGWTWGRRK